MSAHTVANVEDGTYRPSLETVRRIAAALAALGLPAEDFNELKAASELDWAVGDLCGCRSDSLGVKQRAEDLDSRLPAIKVTCKWPPCENARVYEPGRAGHGRKHQSYCHDCVRQVQLVERLIAGDSEFERNLGEALLQEHRFLKEVCAKVVTTVGTVRRWETREILLSYLLVYPLAEELDAPELLDGLAPPATELYWVWCSKCAEFRPVATKDIYYALKNLDYIKSLKTPDEEARTAIGVCKTCSRTTGKADTSFIQKGTSQPASGYSPTLHSHLGGNEETSQLSYPKIAP